MYDATCEMCGEYSPFCEINDDFDDLGVYLCPDCMKEVEKHHLVDGKFVVNRCKCCGHIKGIDFIPYKKRGRPAGHNNKSKIPKNVIPLDKIVELAARRHSAANKGIEKGISANKKEGTREFCGTRGGGSVLTKGEPHLKIKCPHCENVFEFSDPNDISELLMQMENRELRCSHCFTLLTDDDIISFFYNVNTVLTLCKHGVNKKSVNKVLTVNRKMENVPPESAALLPYI